MLFFPIFIFKLSLSQCPANGWNSSTSCDVLTEEVDSLICNVSVIRAQLNRIVNYGFCSAQQCDQLSVNQSNLANQLRNISIQINVNSNQIQDNENRIQELEDQNENETQIEALEEQCELIFPFGGDLERYRSLAYTWLIPGAQAALTSASGLVQSLVYAVPDLGVTAQTQIQRNSNNSQYTMSTQLNVVGPITELPAVHYVQVDLSGQCLSAIYTDMFLFGGYLTGFNYYRPLTKVLSPPYLSSTNSLAFNVHVESAHSMANVFSSTGLLIDRMEDYAVQRERILKGYAMFYYGPYFYTSAQGYKVNVRVIPGDAQKITFLVCFLLGKFDAQLTTDFAHTTTVTLFNQRNPSLFLTGSLQWNLNERNYYNVEVNIPPNFEQDYILDDSLYYKVVVAKS